MLTGSLSVHTWQRLHLGLPLRTVAMSWERMEAYTPTVDPVREQAYLRSFGKPLPLLSNIRLSLQDNPIKTREFYKEHLSQAAESAAMRKIVSQLPTRDEDATSTAFHNAHYLQTKAEEEVRPRKGTLSYMLKEYGA